MQELSIFDFMPEEEAEQYRPKKSTDWKWSMANDYPKEKNGLNVFSCFACGGGSTMGYKLAGCDVIGCCEIDPKMNETYINNHNPKHNFLMDIREFNKIPDEELPKELFNLDILDGSPPCTTFSMAGDREDSWGKKKKFREGQAEQTLDDLSFVFIDTVAKLKPYCVIMENVEGLIKGEAWSYVQRIYKQFDDIGYKVKHWLLKGQHMGVPQARHRVFFIALRKDVPFDLERLDMSFNYEPVTYGEIKKGIGSPMKKGTQVYQMLCQATHDDLRVSDIFLRLGEKEKCFGSKIAWEENVLQTITAKLDYFRDEEKERISKEDIIHAQTFPEDYDFLSESWHDVAFICGMSVPPVMIKRIVTRLIESGVFAHNFTEK
jgi:DNA (cytosine-5)-methyltransferase 1